MLTARVTSGPRISMVASTPSTVMVPSSAMRRSRSRATLATGSGSSGSMPRRRAAKVTDRYMAPVSRYSRPRRWASALATVDLPEPAGPSIAITLIERAPYCASAGGGSQLVQGVPVAGEGLGHAARIGDRDARRPQPEQGEAHGHPVVVVGLDDAPGAA